MFLMTKSTIAFKIKILLINLMKYMFWTRLIEMNLIKLKIILIKLKI